ncbi:MAG: riboflavin biosynthesis protein RibF, partial [Elusimicrobia bacterium]|nr:riboflavin biosynthesis protein RibF [Elusimicrobiota bacterium]
MIQKKCVVTIGTFDGVHRGHRSVLEKTRELARDWRARPAVITFKKPPRLFFSPIHEDYLLSTIQEKINQIKSCGIEEVLALDFNDRLAKMTAEEFFFFFFLRRAHAAGIVVGYDFRFGKGRQGDADFLKQLGQKYSIPVTVLPPLQANRIPISSGRIRNYLREGNCSLANRLLGYPYRVTGKVVRGLSLGKKLGFPTANLKVEPLKILPPGVFVVRASILGGKRSTPVYGLANCGTRPTIQERIPLQKLSLEAHLFQCNENLYGKELNVEFLQRLRSEKKFTTLSQLQRQLEKDKKAALHKVGTAPYFPAGK